MGLGTAAENLVTAFGLGSYTALFTVPISSPVSTVFVPIKEHSLVDLNGGATIHCRSYADYTKFICSLMIERLTIALYSSGSRFLH